MEIALLDLRVVLRSWLLELRREGKSPKTIRCYGDSVADFIKDCERRGVPAELTKENAVEFVDHMLDEGLASATIRLKLIALKRFAKFTAAEEGLDVSRLLTVKAPKLQQKPVPALTEQEVQAMLKTCSGNDLRSRRDKAMLMLLAETGMRASEFMALELEDVSLTNYALLVRNGKGGKARRVRFSAKAAAALDRYMRTRSMAGFGPGPLWVGTRGGPLLYRGLVRTLGRRAQDAGVKNFHAHRLRHTMAVRWLKNGGSETGLMAQAGWKSREMIGRYVNTAAEELASVEFDRLNLGFG